MKNEICVAVVKLGVQAVYALAWALTSSVAAAGTIYTCQTPDGRLHRLEQLCGKYREVSRQEPKVTSVAWQSNAVRATAIAKTKVEGDTENIVAFAHTDQTRTYRVKGFIENLPVNFVVDTGASSVSVPTKIAKWAGIGCMAPIRMNTANGVDTACRSMIKDLRIGDIVLHDVEVVIAKNLSEVLLGQSALRSLRVEQQGGVLKLSSHTKHILASAPMEQP